MPTLSLINFNIVCATLGGFVSLFGLVSFLCKERFYLSEACGYYLDLHSVHQQLTCLHSDFNASRRSIFTPRS